MSAVATKKRPAAKAPAKRQASVPAKADGTDFLKEALVFEGQERTTFGGQKVGTFVRLINSQSNFLKKKHQDYWEGVSEGDYVIKEQNLILGDKVDVTVLAVLKMYEEVEPKDPANPTKMAKRVRRVHPDVAEQFPVTGRFDRMLPNGNALQPIHYVYMLLNKHPDVGVVILSTSMTSNRAITALGKILKAETTLASELRITMTSVQEKDWLIPDFQWAGKRNFTMEAGTVKLVKDGGFEKDTIKAVIEKATQIRKDFADGKIASKDAGMVAAKPQAALPSGYEETEDEEDDGEEVSF